jgi:hypothetical protein
MTQGATMYWKTQGIGRVCAVGLLGTVAALPARAEAVFVPGPTQYIAALGPTDAKAGADAGAWGFWAVDPGPRGVRMRNYPDLVEASGVAPDGWTFDPTAWWIEEHGLIMESPSFDLPAGAYVVTGGREVTAVLTVTAPDAAGKQSWSLSDDASLYDVTHLGCRAALYTPVSGASCTPDQTPMDVFPMRPGLDMPSVSGCDKQDYQVLIVVGMMAEP